MSKRTTWTEEESVALLNKLTLAALRGEKPSLSNRDIAIMTQAERDLDEAAENFRRKPRAVQEREIMKPPAKTYKGRRYQTLRFPPTADEEEHG